MRIITPGLFLAATITLAGCLDDDSAPPSDPSDETEPVACCAVEPRPGGPLNDTVDYGRRVRDRLDWLRRANLRR